MTVQEVLERIDRSWTELNAAMAGIAPEEAQQTGISGDWSLRDIYGHIALWDSQAIIEVKRRAVGLDPRQIDWQALNDEHFAANQNKSYEDQITVFHMTHAELIQTLADLPSVDFESLKEDTWEHYDEHRTDILAWRKANGI
jgi:hypothetical protein